MNEVAYSLAVGVAAVFAWAGIAKLRAPRRTARSFRALGLHPVLARVVPGVELALAVAIVVAPVTAVVAVVLLGAFTVVLARAGDGVTCACFGAATTDPVSWVQLLRNGLLAAAAVVAASATPTTPGVAAVLSAAGVGAIGWLVLALADLKRRTGSIVMVVLP